MNDRLNGTIQKGKKQNGIWADLDKKKVFGGLFKKRVVPFLKFSVYYHFVIEHFVEFHFVFVHEFWVWHINEKSVNNWEIAREKEQKICKRENGHFVACRFVQKLQILQINFKVSKIYFLFEAFLE